MALGYLAFLGGMVSFICGALASAIKEGKGI
jgi:hypothetical protein